MSWQRRLAEKVRYRDFTRLEIGKKVAWYTKEIVRCPHCHRPGANFENGVVHLCDEDYNYIDFCVSDAPEGSPELVRTDYQGRVLEEIDTLPEKQKN